MASERHFRKFGFENDTFERLTLFVRDCGTTFVSCGPMHTFNICSSEFRALRVLFIAVLFTPREILKGMINLTSLF